MRRLRDQANHFAHDTTARALPVLVGRHHHRPVSGEGETVLHCMSRPVLFCGCDVATCVCVQGSVGCVSTLPWLLAVLAPVVLVGWLVDWLVGWLIG